MVSAERAGSIAPSRSFVGGDAGTSVIALAVLAPHHPIVTVEYPVRRAQSLQTQLRGICAGQLSQAPQVSAVQKSLDRLAISGVAFSERSEFSSCQGLSRYGTDSRVSQECSASDGCGGKHSLVHDASLLRACYTENPMLDMTSVPS
jgi:hypothetical protein